MKTAYMTYIIIALVLSIPGTSYAGSKSPGMEEPRYRDSDRDGLNDLFRDADGNGVNDVTGNAYRHKFKFADENGDGENDLFRDSDGDGINDLATGTQNEKSTDITHFVIDFDGDGINDVTGKHYSFEKQGRVFFIDEDGDGINDNTSGRYGIQEKGQYRQYDKFTDEDGDGINDGRGFGRELRDKDSDKHGGRRRRGQK